MKNRKGNTGYAPRLRYNEGSVIWENRAEYFLSPDGRERLKALNEFSNREIKRPLQGD
jgi:hypothetical protein